MKTIIGVTVLMFAAVGAQAQLKQAGDSKDGQRRPTPTVERCNADAKMWEGERLDLAKGAVGAMELLHRASELDVCSRTYYNQPQSKHWLVISNNYTLAVVQRLTNFVDRHHLGDEFLQQDDKGLR